MGRESRWSQFCSEVYLGAETDRLATKNCGVEAWWPTPMVYKRCTRGVDGLGCCVQ